MELGTELFACPDCGGDLRLRDDRLVCVDNERHGFPINNGFPSFVGGHSFDEHWEPHSESGIPQEKRLAAERFLQPLLKEMDEGNVVLDVGCGDGVHAERLIGAEHIDRDIHYVGLDVSFTALVSARRRVRSGTFLHADAAKIPLKAGVVDAIFSYGVIAYTENPADTVRELARVLKPGGLAGFWVYLEPRGIKKWLLRAVRGTTRICGTRVTRLIADLIVPFMAFLPVASGLNLSNASWQQCREVVLVNIAPRQLAFPDRETLMRWIRGAGLEPEFEDATPPLTVWARK